MRGRRILKRRLDQFNNTETGFDPNNSHFGFFLDIQRNSPERVCALDGANRRALARCRHAFQSAGCNAGSDGQFEGGMPSLRPSPDVVPRSVPPSNVWRAGHFPACRRPGPTGLGIP